MSDTRDRLPGHHTGPAWTRLSRTRTRPTRRLVVLAALGVLLYGAGANVQAGWVVVLAALMLGTVPWGWYTARHAATTVEVRRRLARRLESGVEEPVALEVRARSAASLVVHDHLTRAIGHTEDPREGTTVVGRVRLARGSATGGVVTVLTSDPFGLFTATTSARVPSTVDVVPSAAPVRAADLTAAWAIQAGEEASRSGGGPDVMGVREYQHGDPVRAIHWRSSARRNELVVREFADEARPDVRVDIAEGSWEREALDRACEALVGIATDARAHAHPVRIGVDGRSYRWSPAVRDTLASLPPHLGADPRPLDGPPASDAEVTITFRPTTDGPLVVAERGGGRVELGVIPSTADLETVGAWLAEAIGKRRELVGGRR